MSQEDYIKELEARNELLASNLELCEKFISKVFEYKLVRLQQNRKATETAKACLGVTANPDGCWADTSVYLNEQYEKLLRRTLKNFIIYNKDGKQIDPPLKKETK